MEHRKSLKMGKWTGTGKIGTLKVKAHKWKPDKWRMRKRGKAHYSDKCARFLILFNILVLRLNNEFLD